MSFFLTPKARRAPPARSQRGTFRPRIEALEDRCLLSAGALDPTFGIGGKVLGGSINGLGAVVVQTDGKIVVGGAVTDGNGNSDFALWRYMADGSLDTTFGTNGFVSTMVVNVRAAYIGGLALQSNGDIVAVGDSNGLGSVFALARYMPNGHLDSTFGSSGIVLTQVVTATTTTLSAHATAVAIQANGNIVVSGYTTQQTQSGKKNHYTYTVSADFVIVRYNVNVPGKADGTLDTTFGGTGIVVTPNLTNQAELAAALSIQPDGKILQAGYTNSNAGTLLVRYTSAGVLDSSFGPNHSGIVTGLVPSGFAGSGATGVLVQSNGFIVAAGWANTNTSATLMLTRLNSTGTLDPTFGNTGQLGTTDGSKGFAISNSMVYGEAIAQGANGDILTAGIAGVYGNDATYDFGVSAFLTGGALDPTFGTGGTTTAGFSSGSDDRAFAMAIQGDGKIVAAGYSGPPGGIIDTLALARFLPPNTKIGLFTASPNPAAVGGSVTLSASNILNSNPTSTIIQVAFYQDANNDGILEMGTDSLLGTGTQTSPDVWTFTFSTTTSGTCTLFALAQDNNGVFSDPVAVTLQVN